MTRSQARTHTSHTAATAPNPNPSTVASPPCLVPHFPHSPKHVAFYLQTKRCDIKSINQIVTFK
jgi:hypothetical protein